MSNLNEITEALEELRAAFAAAEAATHPVERVDHLARAREIVARLAVEIEVSCIEAERSEDEVEP
jgi:hypothetical protein